MAFSAEKVVMADTFELVPERFDELIERAVAALRNGEVIIAPLEHSYVFVGDAFNHGAVRQIHQLRDDARGVASQVIVGDSQMARGITSEFGDTLQSLITRFWPGMLTVNVAPAKGLVWDLGDARTLNEISIRVPKAEFLRRVAIASGPLAIASAALAGRPAPRSTIFFPAKQSDYSLLFDGGDLTEGPLSTVITVKDDGVMVQRIGAISLAELREVTPNIGIPA